MAISLDELRHVAHLARLNLSEEELLAMHHDLNRVMESFRHLQELQLSGVELTPHSVDITNVWGEDITEPGLSPEDALASAPSTEAGLFLVPTIIDWE
ncbi:MAG: Asp-tRNA(Asn)/Glu-tRNA(Gln) amidotransferase subunit GatC [Fimbriimonadales bacterium]|nr:Asp-tRNA(Asn)/Glu-tRNA(Gln) amidotransferase subunit GatC [Fimbriimonadales bacterium]